MAKESYRKRADALIWIIVVLVVFSLVVLAIPRLLNRRRPFSTVRQNAQFNSISAAIGLFKTEFRVYPPSDANDPAGTPYCGAMKLAEAMMGRDMLGFHNRSAFRADGKSAGGVTELYDPTNLRARKGPFLPPELADCLTLTDIYGAGNTGLFDPNAGVLCDVFRGKYAGGKKAGMPILYYKADTSKTAHDIDNPDNPNNIYNYRDNHALLALGIPGEPGKKHPLFTDPALFYRMTKTDKVPNESKPFKADSYILISAGKDGLYGTEDDICNFEFTFPQE